MQISAPSLAQLIRVIPAGDGVALTHRIPADSLALSSIRDEGPLRLGHVLTVAVAVGEALTALHADQLAHGHITAESIAVAPDGSVHLLDAGASWHYAPGAGGPTAMDDVDALAHLIRELLGRGTAPSSLVLCLVRAADPDPELHPSLPQLLEAVRAAGRPEPLLPLLWGPRPVGSAASYDTPPPAGEPFGEAGSILEATSVVEAGVSPQPLPAKEFSALRPARPAPKRSRSRRRPVRRPIAERRAANRRAAERRAKRPRAPLSRKPIRRPVSRGAGSQPHPGSQPRASSRKLRRLSAALGGLVAGLMFAALLHATGVAGADQPTSAPSSNTLADPATVDPATVDPATADPATAAGPLAEPVQPAPAVVPTTDTAPKWAQVLAELDDRRLAALAAGSAKRLELVVDPLGSAWAADSSLVERISSNGATLQGCRLSVEVVRPAISIEPATSDSIELEVRDRRTACEITTTTWRRTLAARGSRWWLISLTGFGDGWRIAQVRVAPELAGP